jgi:hypothetical protein
MSDDILKGNYKIKKQIKEKEISIDEQEKLKEELKERALASLGGSMVYVERDKLFWDGSDIGDQIAKE